jgi:hypothetical protein
MNGVATGKQPQPKRAAPFCSLIKNPTVQGFYKAPGALYGQGLSACKPLIDAV